ncbi:MAG: hypothetical protein Q9195_008984 [Heterodermia aff. obscurata]
MGILFCRRLSTNRKRYAKTHRKDNLHSKHPLRFDFCSGAFWHFTADLSLKDAAYTSLALAAHTDNTYFTDPAGLQTFHVLSHTNGAGGASLLIDGFRAAEILRSESPDAFNDLCNIKINAHSSGNEGISIMPNQPFPVLVTTDASQGAAAPEVIQIRWNNDDRATLPVDSPEDITRWYAAARKWVEILRRPDSEYWVQLEPGRPLIFDNWRVLHGRSAFTGDREMCGGYTNMDDFLSRWKTLNFPKDEIMNYV